SRQVCLVEVLLCWLGVKLMPFRLWAAVHGVVRGACGCLEASGILSLQPSYGLHAEFAGEVWVFAKRLLASSPAGIAYDVDVWRPEIQPLILAPFPAFGCMVMLCPRLVRNRDGNPPHKVTIPTGAHADHLWENRCLPCTANAVACFI